MIPRLPTGQLRHEILIALRNRAPTKFTVAELGQILGIQPFHEGYPNELARIGSQLYMLWRLGEIKCSGIQRKYRHYWIEK